MRFSVNTVLFGLAGLSAASPAHLTGELRIRQSPDVATLTQNLYHTIQSYTAVISKPSLSTDQVNT